MQASHVHVVIGVSGDITVLSLALSYPRGFGAGYSGEGGGSKGDGAWGKLDCDSWKAK
jgi:hypothetical protein